MSRDLELTLMVADYHRTHPFFSGEVSIDGVKLSVYPPQFPGHACQRPIYEEFDVAEMSLSWYVMARCRGEPVIALPIFPLRMFIQPYLFCGKSSEIDSPSNLKGKTVGIHQYRITIGLWARGILEEHYGVSPEDIHWITSDLEGAGYEVPKNVHVTLQEQDPEQLLLKGEVDALISANVPASFRNGDPRIRRLFRNCRASVEEYFRKTKIFPITHTMVIRESLLRERPWIAARIVDAFQEADRRCRSSYEYPKRLSFPTAVLFLEEEEEIFGREPWVHGVKENSEVLEKFVQYAQKQGYIAERPNLNDLFCRE